MLRRREKGRAKKKMAEIKVLTKRNLAIASLASKKEKSRFTPNGLYVTPEATVETDGSQLCMVSTVSVDAEEVPVIPEFTLATEWNSFLLPATSASEIAKAIPHKSRIPILRNAFIGVESENGHAQLATTDLDHPHVFTPAKLEGTFPNYARIIPDPQNQKFCISFDANVLEPVLKQIRDFCQGAPKAICRLYFTDRNSPVRIDADYDNQHFIAVVMPCRDSFPEAKLDENLEPEVK